VVTGRARVEQGDDVRVAEARDDGDLAQEAVAPDVFRHLRVHDLDRDRPVVSHIVREVDGCHAAAPDLALDPVAVRWKWRGLVGQLGAPRVLCREWLGIASRATDDRIGAGMPGTGSGRRDPRA
jgi:hypothetical protein